MKQTTLTSLLITGGLVAATGSASATLLGSDSFDYPAGQNLSQPLAGGAGWTTDWVPSGGNANTLETVSTGLTFGSLTTSGGALADADITKKQGAYRNFGGGALSDDTRYASFLFSVTSAEAYSGELYYAGLNNSGGNASNAGAIDGFAVVGATATTFDVATKSGNNFGNTVSGLTFGSAYLFVFEITEAPVNSEESVKLWVNPDVSSSVAPGIVDSTYTGNLSLGDVQQFAMSMKSNAGSADESFVFSIDEIRVGDTFADVTPVPEPGTYALIGGLLSLSYVMVRRRK